MPVEREEDSDAALRVAMANASRSGSQPAPGGGPDSSSNGGGTAAAGTSSGAGGTPTARSARDASIDELRRDNERLRAALSVYEAGSPGAAGDRNVLHELAALRMQVESMRAMLPILTIPNFTFSLVPSGTNEGGKEVATYEILVNYGENVYAVYRRYSEFRALHDKLEQAFKEEHLPKFPGRQGLFRSTNTSRQAIERRRKELQTYIRQLVASDDVRNSELVRNFFAQLSLEPDGGEADLADSAGPQAPSEEGDA